MMKKTGTPVIASTLPTYHVFYHGSCQDGYHAAIVFLKWYHEVHGAVLPYKFHASYYGSPMDFSDVQDGDRVYILDFSTDRSSLDALAARAELVVLDHHETALKALEGAPYATFDLTKSGARLAWEHFFSDAQAPDWVKWTEDGDLWLFKYSETKVFREYFRQYMKSWTIEEGYAFYLNPSWLEEVNLKGSVCMDILKSSLEKAKKRVRKGKFSGVPTLFVESLTHTSEIGEMLYEKYPDHVACVWSYNPDKHRISVSLRSLKASGIKVNVLAEEYQGGGHPAAAGCSMLVRDFEHLLNMGIPFDFEAT